MGIGAKKLRELINTPGCYAGVGVWDAITAKIAESEGIDVLFLLSSGISLSQLGTPDLGYLTQTEMADVTRRITNIVATPCIVDTDDGYGTPLNMKRNVQVLGDAGAAALYFEDLAFPKRGALFGGGGGLIPREMMLHKIKAAVEARGDRDLIIIARTDPYEGLDESIYRGNAYADAGADIIFVDGINTTADRRRICKEIHAPIMQAANYTEADGRALSLADFEDIGVKLLAYTIMGFLNSQNAFRNAMRKFRQSLDKRTEVPDMGPSFSLFLELEKMLGVDDDLRLSVNK